MVVMYRSAEILPVQRSRDRAEQYQRRGNGRTPAAFRRRVNGRRRQPERGIECQSVRQGLTENRGILGTILLVERESLQDQILCAFRQVGPEILRLDAMPRCCTANRSACPNAGKGTRPVTNSYAIIEGVNVALPARPAEELFRRHIARRAGNHGQLRRRRIRVAYSGFLVKRSRDDGATWQLLEYMGIAQKLPDGFKNTYDLVVEDGEGKPQTRRLPYNDFGIILAHDVMHGAGEQTVQTATYGANRLGFDVGEFVHVNLGKADEEYVQVLDADPDNQTFDAIFTNDHALGAAVRPTIWPTAILNEGDSLAFDILGVASPDPGSDLTVVIQT